MKEPGPSFDVDDSLLSPIRDSDGYTMIAVHIIKHRIKVLSPQHHLRMLMSNPRLLCSKHFAPCGNFLFLKDIYLPENSFISIFYFNTIFNNT